ncbi:tyrosine-protein kinase JAK2 [Lepeophtheirus salmonis]|uniref:tyrosine-protein kinase JAK2 n=1 Tax=Lepeophtheirus salmonis TaxID=72036 RepID=UPI001AE41E2A|nr:tyrosine-protein kinase JAK2-like [Lepeophtheirus salmonis]
MEVRYYNEEDDMGLYQPTTSKAAEFVISDICQYVLSMHPQAKYLFNLRNISSGTWLTPDKLIQERQILELRLRFKVPGPDRLLSIDPRAFQYFYLQVREDFKKGLVINERTWNGPDPQSSSTSLWFPVIEIKSGKNSDYLSDHYASATKLTSLTILIHMLSKSLTLKETLKNLSSYTPKGLWLDSVDRLFGRERFKNNAKNLIITWQKNKKSILSLKKEFLSLIQEQYPGYFTETFSNVTRIDRGSELSQVTLFVTAPFLSALDTTVEKDPELRLHEEGHKKTKDDFLVCTVEDICNISAGSSEEIQILRKNGMPEYFRFKSSHEKSNLLTLLCGYYRLCEKWIFSLSNNVVYPSLNFLLKHNIHGPVHTDFVDKKFAERSGNFGSLSNNCFYILHQDTESYDTIFLHISDIKGKRKSTYKIKKSDNLGYGVSPSIPGIGFFLNLQDLISNLNSRLELGRCLHPSEFDKDSGLLLCRSIRRLQTDVSQSSASGPFFNTGAVFIPFRALGRYENVKKEGRFTNVWKGQWLKSRSKKEVVAIKQLKPECEKLHLQAFSNMSNKIMSCSDSTIATVLGFCPSYCNQPSAIILEYFNLGPLDEFLRNNSESIKEIELIEAAAGLARALWYLTEQRIVHGNIRCKSVFVRMREEDSFKVKLGDPGISDHSLEKDAFWLPPEVFSSFINTSLTILPEYPEIDTWAYSTTLWEIFAYGQSPHTQFPEFTGNKIANLIIGGERLPKPISILKESKLLPMYKLMNKCWCLDPTLRNSPQQILKDVNQLFYRVYNSRMTHSYVTIKEPREDSLNEVEDSVTTTLSEIHSTPCQFASNKLNSSSILPMFPPSASSNSLSQDPLIRKEADVRRMSSDYGSYLNSQSTSVYTAYFTYSQCTSIYSLGEHQLELNKDCPIGEGHFGIVYRGTISRSDGDWDEVAVKMLKESDFNLDANASMKTEFDLMKELRHENVVKIKGTLEESDRIIIIMEYLREGSLDKYLIVHECNLKEDRGKRLFKYALGIADGMEYLASKNIIHRDLAARNILVADETTVKIADFGLARVSSDYYVMSSSSSIPVKWLAPECLTNKVYSTASDIWAFGVTLWEMFSYGKIPNLIGCEDFFNESGTQEQHSAEMQKFVEALLEGRRFPRTEDCSHIVYNELILPCWEKDSKNRPNFTALKRLISNIELRVA